MSVLLDINGQEFAYPEVNDVDWGADATDWAVAVTNGMLQKAGGNFILLADVDFGANFGLLSKYFSTRTAAPAVGGVVRLANTDVLSWRNFTNDEDLSLSVNEDNELVYDNGVISQPIQTGITALDTSTINLTLTGVGALSADIIALSISDSLISASAAIALSKLAAVTASRALVSDGSGFVSAATTTATEIGYVNGVTSAIQTQLNTKAAAAITISTTAPLTGGGDLSANRTFAIPVATALADGYLASADWSTFNGKQASGNYITALTGDATASGPGSAALTLATVNSNVGSFGSSTSIPSLTVNAKGLVTAASGNAVVAPAGTLSGATLAAGVTASSLTSVGTIATGVWQGTVVGMTYGGSGKALTPDAGGIVWTDSNSMEVLAHGNVGEVLTSGGTGTPTWSAPLTNPMDSAGDMIVGGVAGAATKLDSGSSGLLLMANGAASPTWVSTITGAKTFSSAITASAGITFGGGTLSVFAQGTWSPGPTSGTNITSMGATQAYYVRIGNMVIYQWRLSGTVTTGSNTTTSLVFTIPVATTGNSDIVNGTSYAANGATRDVGGVEDNSGGDATTAFLTWKANASGSTNVQVWGIYAIQ